MSLHSVSSASLASPVDAGYGRAIALHVTAVAAFSVMGLLIKLLEGRYPTSEIILFRCWPALIPLMLYMPVQGGWSALKSRRPFWQGVRAVMGVGSMFLGFAALQAMAFADYVAISFTAPLFGTLLAIPILGEAVGWRRMGAIGIGFAGAVLTAGPVAGTLDPMVFLALASAFGYGIAMVAMRKLGSTDKSAATVFYFMVLGGLAGAVMVPGEWVTPTPADLGILLSIGVIGGIAQILATEAFRLAPPSIVAPFDYTAMLWALLFGWLFFATFPAPSVLVGALLICASGLFIIHRETVRGIRRGRIKGSSL